MLIGLERKNWRMDTKKPTELTEGFKSGEGLSSPLQSLTYYGQTLLRYQAVDGIAW